MLRSGRVWLVQRRAFAIADRYEQRLRRPVQPRERNKGGRRIPTQPTHVERRKVEAAPAADQHVTHYTPEEEELVFTPSPEPSPEGSQTVTVAFVGLANAGKSTLLNKLVGLPHASVSPRAHTTRTWSEVGVLRSGVREAVLLDTPGLAAEGGAGLALAPLLREGLDRADRALVVVDAAEAHLETHRLQRLARTLQHEHDGVILTQLDRLEGGHALQQALDTVRETGLVRDTDAPPLLVSGRTGAHVGDVQAHMLAWAQPGVWRGNLMQASRRQQAAEAVREAAFCALQAEVPYGVAIKVVHLPEETATTPEVVVELGMPKTSQVALAVGRGGSTVRVMAEAAAARLARLWALPHVSVVIRVVKSRTKHK